MKQIKYICEVCGDEYQARKEHDDPKHCHVCAEWLRSLDLGPRQRGTKDYRKLGFVVVDLIRKGKLGESDFIRGVVESIRK